MLNGTTSHSRWAATAVLLLLSLAAGASRAQSLADVAKKEEERRKTTPDAGKVYTNKDLVHAAAGSTPAAAAKPADAKDADKTAKDATSKDDKDSKSGKDGKDSKDDKDKGPRDQAYWSAKLKALKDTQLRDENYADAMQTRINSLTADFANHDDPAQRAVIGQNRQKALAELERLTKSVADTRRAIADLLEDARRAAVPPGWLR